MNGASTILSQQYSFLDPDRCSPRQLWVYVQSLQSSDYAKKLFGLRQIEKTLLSQSRGLENALPGERGEEPQLLLSLVVWYRDHQTTQFHEDESRRLQQLSMYTAICWVAFCVAHKFCATAFPDVAKYGIALDWERLDVCVLRERSAREAVVQVVQYIRTWNHQTNGPSLFDLGNQKGTLALVRSLGTAMYEHVFASVQKKWHANCQSTWMSISQRKDELQTVRQEISNYQTEVRATKERLDVELERLVQEWNEENPRTSRRGYYRYTPNLGNRLTKQYRAEIRRLEHLIRQKETKRDRIRRMTEFLVSPLPFDKTDALQILCLISPSRDIDILAELCWLAQRSLSPSKSLVSVGITNPGSRTWLEHFQRYSGVTLGSSALYAIAFPNTLIVPDTFGLNWIDDVSSEEAFVRANSWYPDIAGTTIHWKDPTSDGKWINPFLVGATVSRKLFTPCISDDNWQWVVEFPVVDARQRGNSTYAHWGQRGGSTGCDEDTLEFWSRGALRAYPFQQLCRVFASIETDSLTWSNPIVVELIRQTVFQVGHFQCLSTPCRLAWHEHLEDMDSVNGFCVNLDNLVGELDHSPRRWACIPLLSDLAGFLCQYSRCAKPLVEKLSRMARRWANDTRQLWMREGVTDAERKELRTRECILYGYAVLCYDYSSIWASDDEAVEDVCKLLVLFHNAKLFAVGDCGFVLDAIQSRIDKMMADRIWHIVKFLRLAPNRSQFMTQLCDLVSSSNPNDLAWYRTDTNDEDHFTSCFIATHGASETQYVINVFSGAIETNGSLPSGLPESIRQLPLYRKLFDDHDSEVTRRGDIYKTTKQSGDGGQYRFRVRKTTGELLVEEWRSSCQLQLCTQGWCEQFAGVFPLRLSKLYTHWVWIEKRIVLLRTPRVSSAQTHFVVKFDECHRAHCFEVPRHDWELSCVQLLSQLDQYPVFVVGQAQLVCVFSKFEAVEYIHVMRLPEPSNAIQVKLPRFGLQFQETADGMLASIGHRGFILSREQQLSSGQMPRYRQYLVLVNEGGPVSQRRLLIPNGAVKTHGSGRYRGLVYIDVSSDPAAAMHYAAVDEHPRIGIFSPDTLEARIQLGGICAACDNRLPWRDLGMTGGEMSLQLLRGCNPSRPYSIHAAEQLVAIGENFAFKTPVLTLFVSLLLDKSRRLEFLFDSNTAAIIDIADAVDEYRSEQSTSSAARVYPYRQCLSRAEEWDLFGSVADSETLHARAYDVGRACVKVAADEYQPPIDGSFIRAVEAELAFCCKQSNGILECHDEKLEVPGFPLSPPMRNAVREYMINTLQDSWEAFHRHDPCTTLTYSHEDFLNQIRCLLSSVRIGRQCLEDYLLDMVKNARNSIGDQLLVTVGRHAQLRIADIMRSVLDSSTSLPFTARLDSTARQQWKRSCICFLEVCVLEDKLERLLDMSATSRVLEELQTVKRAWSSEEHPYWLVFEVEGRLQIRHEQYVIASHLIDNPGSICQLNMGRGKTRVILPMLFLYYSYKTRNQSDAPHVVRAHFLSALLSETRDFMWRVLTSCVFQLPFVELPFNRSYSLGQRELRLMQLVLCEANRNGAVIMVAPEHRLSLELKRVEIGTFLEADKPSFELRVLEDILDRHQYIDIFDESDALLHHGYHLVYAVGASVVLDGGSNRWLAAEALLRVLVSGKSTRVQQALVRYPNMWSLRPEYRARGSGGGVGGTFNGFQISVSPHEQADTTSGVDARTVLRLALVEDLMDDAPFDLEWLRVFSSNREVRVALLNLLTDVTIDADAALVSMPSAIQNARQQVLALRGLLSFGILENCLEMRYRVNYGHPRAGSRPKAMAILYKAADLPADRSEFSHPDVSIVLTLLSYYHSGLNDGQIRRTFDVLLSLDSSESLRYYNEWFKSVEPSITNPQVRETLENVTHISLDNAHQFGTVCSIFRYAMEVINFFVNFCVFPSDTRQFPSRLSRSAWDLVRGPKNIGFSGTNDTHMLLPLAVAQREPNEPTLCGTNGKMIAMLLDSTHGYEVLALTNPLSGTEVDRDPSTTRACWQSLLYFAVEKQCDALIDTGALLAGVSNLEAARFLMSLPGFTKQGITFYDTRPSVDGWFVYEKSRNLVHPLKTSSLKECDTFVIFDEARSRGSDMKLLPNAVAVLSLGPTITKDKLMQGAGRLRQLGPQFQTLWLTSAPDVHACSIVHQAQGVQDGGSIGVVDILNWVMDNTQRQCTFGLLEWAHSGIQFHAKELDPQCEVQADDWSLTGLYAGARTERLISEVIATKIDTKECSLALTRQPQTEPATESERAMESALVTGALRQIHQQGVLYGSQDVVNVTSLGEECEHELQIEEEQEEEREITRHDVQPCPENVWKWSIRLDARSVHYLGVSGPLSLADAVQKWFEPTNLRSIAWGPTKIYGTANFWSSVTTRGNPQSSASLWTSCLRHIHGLLVFCDGTTLLLSEFEEDAVASVLHQQRHVSGEVEMYRGQFALVQLPFLVGSLRRIEHTPESSIDLPVSSLPLALGWDHGQLSAPATLTIPFIAVVGCCLLNGDTDLFLDYHPKHAEPVLRQLLRPLHQREETMQAFISLRGFPARWKRSNLHAITKRLDLEEDSQQGPQHIREFDRLGSIGF